MNYYDGAEFHVISSLSTKIAKFFSFSFVSKIEKSKILTVKIEEVFNNLQGRIIKFILDRSRRVIISYHRNIF